MNHLRTQWRAALTKDAIAARNGLRVQVRYVGRANYEDTNWQGTVLDGTGYRAFGTWKEFKDSLRAGRWRSKGTFTIPGEGETQFASSLEDLLRWNSPGSGHRGNVGIIEADLSGCKFRTFIPNVTYGEGDAGGFLHLDRRNNRPGGYLWLPHEGADEGMIYPDTGLGIGIDGGVPLDQVIRVYEVEDGKIQKSWPFREWESHIDSVTDYSTGWVPEVKDDPMTHRIWVSWVWAFVAEVKRWEVMPLNNKLFHNCPNGSEKGVCGVRMGDILNDARELLYGENWYRDNRHYNMAISHVRAMEGHIKGAANSGILQYEEGKALKTVKAKPCPRCWPRYR